jgi:cyclophilin family peptidyl-prolyl cis-trans isomerase
MIQKYIILLICFLGLGSCQRDYLVSFKTDFGEMKAILHNQTPKHKANFVKLTKEGFYNNLLFHRVINSFMIQGGDPNSRNAAQGVALGVGGPQQKIPAEFVPELFHKKGALAAARDNNPEKASSGSQFYIVQGRVWDDENFEKQMARTIRKPTDEQRKVYQTLGGTPHLDGNYTVFGQVIEGFAVIDSIAKQKGDAQNRPLRDVRMQVSIKKVSIKKLKQL